MNTITLIAHNRPSYTAQTIMGLTEALLNTVNPVFDKLIFSIDPGNSEVVDVCEKAAEVLANGSVIECVVYVNKGRLSDDGTIAVATNTELALMRAFEENDSDFNLSIEDDAVLTPDATLIAEWFLRCHGGPTSGYLLMSMCNHRDFGRNRNPGTIPNDPSYIAEAAHITSPFAWCLSRYQWPFVRDSWNKKIKFPMGWDWSLSYAMRLEKKRALHPVLSRCRNIGREGGVHESVETFDHSQLGLTYSDGTYSGDYRIVARIPDSELEQLDPWMTLELGRSSR